MNGCVHRFPLLAQNSNKHIMMLGGDEVVRETFIPNLSRCKSMKPFRNAQLEEQSILNALMIHN